jgi:hypothetical protein
MLTEYGETLKRLSVSFGTITADAYPTASYKGNITHLDLIRTNITDSALSWMVESGVLSSPTIVALYLSFKPDDRLIHILPYIKAPNLTKLDITGWVFLCPESICKLFQLLDRSPSITALKIGLKFGCDASFFIAPLESMPALRKLSTTDMCTYSESVFRWALSDRNKSVESLTLVEFPVTSSLTPNEFFLHPCVAYVRCTAEPAIKYKAMHAAKKYTVHFAYMVRNNKALARLPTELVLMIFTF